MRPPAPAWALCPKPLCHPCWAAASPQGPIPGPSFGHCSLKGMPACGLCDPHGSQRPQVTSLPSPGVGSSGQVFQGGEALECEEGFAPGQEGDRVLGGWDVVIKAH